jgi:hypothetical protein
LVIGRLAGQDPAVTTNFSRFAHGLHCGILAASPMKNQFSFSIGAVICRFASWSRLIWPAVTVFRVGCSDFFGWLTRSGRCDFPGWLLRLSWLAFTEFFGWLLRKFC